MSNASTIAKLAALLTGAAVSLLAGYISVTGLAALFPAGGAAVLAMGAAMEVGKVVSVACWRHTAGPLRAGLTALVLLLITVTGLGVYGFLSSAHRSGEAPALAAAVEADRLAADLALARAAQAQAEARLQRLDAAVDALPADWATRKQVLRQSQAAERAEVQAAITAAMVDQRRINAGQAAARVVHTAAELAPIRYAASALGWSDDEAVNAMILLLMLGFDPLGLALVAAGTGSAARRKAAPDAVMAILRGGDETAAPVYQPRLRLVKR
jgi:hypothetical protein